MIEENRETLIILEVNAEKTKCMMMSRHQDAGQNHNVETGNKS
jgi:hypothetical protein